MEVKESLCGGGRRCRGEHCLLEVKLLANDYLIRESFYMYNLVSLYIMPECSSIRPHFCAPPYVRSPISALPHVLLLGLLFHHQQCGLLFLPLPILILLVAELLESRLSVFMIQGLLPPYVFPPRIKTKS